MKINEMRAIVRSELDHFPRGSRPQNLFRATYQTIRMHSLGSKPTSINSAGAAYKFALAGVRTMFPGFVPTSIE